MALVYYTFEVRDGGVLKPGLTPSFLHLKRLADNAAISPQPTIGALGNGQYKFQFDPEAAGGEASAVIDAGPDVASPAERYFGLMLALDSSRIQASLSSTGKVHVAVNDDKAGYGLAPEGLDLVEVEDGVSVPTALSRIGATTAGVSDGGGTLTMRYYAMGHPGTLRVEAQVEPEGNRTSVEYS